MATLCRLLLAGTFVFSGFVKIVDPQGMCHKLEAYALALGQTFTDSDLAVRFAAGIIGVFEFVLGIYILLGIRRKLTTRITLVFMAAMTALTVWIYLKNPVPDCGCFGEAVVLTNGQTLAKNIVLLLCSLFLTRYPLYLHRLISERNQWVISIYAWVYAAGVCYTSFRNLPVLEFTPYTVGADLRGAVEGTVKADDGGISPLANFYLNTPQGDDCTFEVLADTSWQFLLIAPDCATADDGCCDRINSLYDYCVDKGYAFSMATASAPQDIYDWIDRTGAAYPILLADETELKSAVRANPGLMLLHNGRIAAKWSNNNLPEYRDEDDITANVPTSSTSPLTRMLLWFIVPLLLIAPNCATADDGCCDRINSLYDYCVDKGYAFRMATASAPQDIYDWIDRTGAAYPILLADETELKSAVRANPGLMLLHDGRIAAKWSNNNLPEYRDEDDIATNVPTSSTSPLTRMLLWFIVPLIIIIFLDGLWVGSKYYKRYRIRKTIFSGNNNPEQ